MPDWLPIASAPHDETGEMEILVYGGDGYFVACWDRLTACWVEASSGDPLRGEKVGDWNAPTHWMPLPSAPQLKD